MCDITNYIMLFVIEESIASVSESHTFWNFGEQPVRAGAGKHISPNHVFFVFILFKSNRIIV